MKFKHFLSDSLRYGWFRVKGSCLSMSETSLLVSHILQPVQLDLQQDLSMDWFRAMLLDDRLVHPRFAHCSQYHNSQLYKTILNERFVALIPFLATRDHDMHRLLTGSQPPTDHDLLTAPRALVLTWPSQYPQPGSSAGMRCLVPWNRKLSTYMTGTDERSIMYGWNPEAFREGTGKYTTIPSALLAYLCWLQYMQSPSRYSPWSLPRLIYICKNQDCGVLISCLLRSSGV
jgi:hypothetical protein